MQINLKHHQTGVVKLAPLGFSWTTVFGGVFVPLFRGDLKWCCIMMIAALFSFGMSWLVFPFLYNKLYVKDLIEKGFVPADDFSRNQLQAAGVMFHLGGA